MPMRQPPFIFVLQHLLLPALVFAGIVLLLDARSVDLRLADWIYRQLGSAWTLRDAWLTRDLLHTGGRRLVGALFLLLMLLTAGASVLRSMQSWRRALWYLVLSVVLAGLTVNLLKRLTHIDCPWDLLRYGGEFPYTGLLDAHPGSFRYGACFPAGHASAGYAWLGLYFVVRECLPQLRWQVLGVVLGTGMVFGVAQQLRGAHFLSHDLWTLAICWSVAVLLYAAFDCRLAAVPVKNSG